MNNNKRIAIFGSYSGYNKGDLAILISIIENLSKLNKDIIFMVPSKKPQLIKKFLSGIGDFSAVIYKSFTVYWGLYTIQCIRSADILVFGGGGLFFDDKPYNIFYNHILNLFVISLLNKLLFNKPVYIFSVGSTSIKSKVMILMTKFILKNANYITVRDNLTTSIFSLYSDRNIDLHFDPAFLINKSDKRSNNLLNLSDSEKRILFVLNESFLKKEFSDSKIHSLVRVINELQEKYQVVLTYNLNESKNINKLYELCKKVNLQLFHPKNSKPDEIIHLYSFFDFVVSVPLHSAIFAYNAETRLITIEYNQKVLEFNKITGNKNSVKIGNLDRIIEILMDYHEIDWQKKRKIKENSFENFLKLTVILNDLQDKKIGI